MKPRKAIIQFDDKGKCTLPGWVWKRLLKMSGSKATTENGQRRAVRKEFHKALYLLLDKHKQNLD